jgi:hypothetical protein
MSGQSTKHVAGRRSICSRDEDPNSSVADMLFRFEPRFEITHGRLVTTAELNAHPSVPGLFNPVIRRDLIDAGAP